MSKPGKRFRAARETIDRDHLYSLEEAVKFMAHVTSAKKTPENRSTGGKVVDRLDGAVTFGMNAIILKGYDSVLRAGQSFSAEINFG